MDGRNQISQFFNKFKQEYIKLIFMIASENKQVIIDAQWNLKSKLLDLGRPFIFQFSLKDVAC